MLLFPPHAPFSASTAKMPLAMDVADRLTDSFPDYTDPFEPLETMTGVTSIPVNKAVAGMQAVAESRHPSPQPSHLWVPHQASRKTTMGYVAPTFLEKPIPDPGR